MVSLLATAQMGSHDTLMILVLAHKGAKEFFLSGFIYPLVNVYITMGRSTIFSG